MEKLTDQEYEGICWEQPSCFGTYCESDWLCKDCEYKSECKKDSDL